MGWLSSIFGNNDAKNANNAAQALSEQQFQWQKDQAAAVAKDAADKRAAMSSGLDSIGKAFSGFDDPYYKGLQDSYLAYANPQIERNQATAQTALRSALANKGKLHSSTDAAQQGEMATTYGGIFRDAQTKSLDYANSQRDSVNAAKNSSISQMYASESPDVGLQAASGAVGALKTGPAFEPISGLLNQAAKYATMDYNNSIYNNQQSYGLFSPMTNSMASNAQANSASSGNGGVSTIR